MILSAAAVILSLVGLLIGTGSPPPSPGGEVHLSVEDFQAVLEKREQEVKQSLAQAHGEERTWRENELTEVKRQLSDIEPAYADALQQISELETALVARLGDDISDKQLAEIRATIEAGDFSKADALLAEIEDRTDVAVVRAAAAAFQRGKIAVIQVKWGEAATHFDKAARLNPTYAHLNEAGIFANRTARHKAALRHFEELLKLSQHEYGEGSSETATALNNLALVLQDTGQYAEAERLYRQVLEIVGEVFGEEHPDYATTLNNFAGVLQATGQYAEAERLHRQVLEIRWEVFGEEHPRYATPLNNLAGVLQATGQYAEAERLFRQTLEIFRASLGDNHPNTKKVARSHMQLYLSLLNNDAAP